MAQPTELLLIGICTYLRPKMLGELLAAIAALETPPGTRVETLIVDNDPAASARESVETARTAHGLAIHYRVEEKRGIANARNRVLDEAVAIGADLLALIDDDEIMRADWLTALHARMAETGADAVGAPVYWDLPADAPAWAHALPTSPRYEALYAHREKQKARRNPSTNNVLMRAKLYREWGLRFDARFGLAAGEDLDFFLRAKAKGARYAFTPDAALKEHVPASRLSLKWRFSRWIAFASVNAMMYRFHHGAGAAWRHYLPRALPRFVIGPLLIAWSPIGGPLTFVHGLKQLGGGIGTIRGLMGSMLEEYRQVHGG